MLAPNAWQELHWVVPLKEEWALARGPGEICAWQEVLKSRLVPKSRNESKKIRSTRAREGFERMLSGAQKSTRSSVFRFRNQQRAAGLPPMRLRHFCKIRNSRNRQCCESCTRVQSEVMEIRTVYGTNLAGRIADTRELESAPALRRQGIPVFIQTTEMEPGPRGWRWQDAAPGSEASRTAKRNA